MSRRIIFLDIFPATETHCAPPDAHVLNPNGRCPKMRVGSESAWCSQFDAPILKWKRLHACLAAEIPNEPK